MKKFFLTAVAVMLLLCFAACGRDAVTDSSTAPSSAFKENKDAAAASFTGVVADASIHQLTVKAQDGKSAVFLLNDDTAYVFLNSEGLQNGMKVLVEYTPAVDSDAEGTAITVTEVEAAELEEHTFTGLVMDASMNNISVLDEENMQVDFPLNDQVIYRVTGGIGVNMTVTVVYTGEIADGSAADCTVLRIEEVEPAPPATQSFLGEVIDASMNSLLVESLEEEGLEVNFSLNDNVVYTLGDDGITLGMYVVINYTGNIVDGSAVGCIVLEVKELSVPENS